MNIVWQKIDVGEYATLQRAQGAVTVRAGGVIWRRVRPFFYRPLLPFEELVPASARAPNGARLGGCQFAVPAGQAANSAMIFRIFENVPNYAAERLDKNPRYQVNAAAKRLDVRPVTDPGEFRKDAYPVYLSFFDRTRYAFQTGRRSPEGFARWTDSLFHLPGNLVLGAYHAGTLGAVCVSQLVEDTLIYSTFFCDSESLKHHAADLMLHSVRAAAARHGGIRRIFAGVYKDGTGVDRFYLLRGCRALRKPAWLSLSPASALLLRCLLPGQYARLRGRNLEEAVGESTNEVVQP